jgi:lipopolysaccharide transport system permease protein
MPLSTTETTERDAPAAELRTASPPTPSSGTRDMVTVISPTKRRLPITARELWTHRELFFFLVWRDIKVRYAQTALGAAWMVFQPLAMMLVYTFAFSHIAKITNVDVPYPLFALSGLTLWIFVSRGVFMGAESLVVNGPILTKTSSPRVIITLAAVVSVLIDFLIALGVFLIIAGVYGRAPTWRYLFVPPLLLAAFVLTLGLSLLLAPTNVRYRDVGQALPFLIQLWFFLSPVAYLLQTPGHSWETIVQALNPLVGLILAFRWALLGTPAPHGLLVVSVAISFVLLAFGALHFARLERTLADDI